MLVQSRPLWAVLVATATASPLVPRQLRYGVAPGEAAANEQLWCGTIDKLSTIDNAREALGRTGMAASIDIYLGDDSPAGWLENIQRFIFRDEEMEGASARACANVESECSPGKGWSCRDTFQEGERTDDLYTKMGWWIFTAVKGVHDKMRLIRKHLIDETITTGLKIADIAKDFETTLNDEIFKSSELPAWVSTVLGIGQTAVGLSTTINPGVGAALSVLGTAWDFADSNTEEDEDVTVDLASIQSKLADIFSDSVDGIDRILRASMGRAWDEHKGDYDKLPLLGSTDLSQHIANFYNAPFWLLDGDSKAANELVEAATNAIRQHIVDIVIQGLEYAVLWDSTIESEEDCIGNGRKWMHIASYDRCFTMGYKDGRGPVVPVDEDTKLWENMENWGIPGPEVYYRSSIECARSRCDNVNRNTVESVGQRTLPLCYFSAPVLKYGKPELRPGQTDCDDVHSAACVGTRPYNSDFWPEENKVDCPE